MSGADPRLRAMLKLAPVIPVFTPDDVDDAVQVAQALFRGGLPVIEVTLRTPRAMEAIKAMVEAVPEAVIGAGTVLEGRQLEQLKAVGGLEQGLDTFKFFPAVQAGGAAMLAAWNGPFGDVRFCPTGGISAQTAAQFLHLPNVLCVGGSWLTTRELLHARNWAGIEQLAREAAVLPG